MAYNTFARLVADIGGTNARFALAVGDAKNITQQKSVRTQDHPSFVSAARDYLRSVGAEKIQDAAIAVATAVNGEFVARGLRSGHVLAEGDQVQCFRPIVGG